MTLLNVLTESSDIEIERNFFAENPEKGKLYEWPIVGSLADPNWLSEAERKNEVLALNTSYDDLPHRVPQLHSWLHEPISEEPTAYFFHCEGGSDRTG